MTEVHYQRATLPIVSGLVDNQYAIASVETNYNFVVNYKKLPIILHLNTAGIGGSIDLTLENGSTFTCNFSVQEDEGWKVNSIMLNNSDVTANWNAETGYTTPALTSESTLSVAFEYTSNAIDAHSLSPVKAYASAPGTLTVEEVTAGEEIHIYTTDGVLVKSVIATGNRETVLLNANTLYIVKTAGKTIKVGL